MLKILMNLLLDNIDFEVINTDDLIISKSEVRK